MAYSATFTGQDANKSEGSDVLVVNNTGALTFTINGGAENFAGDDPNTAFDESLDDTITYTDYDGYTYTANFTITYEGAFNWANGNKAFDPNASTEGFIIEITNVISTDKGDGGADEIGETWTIMKGAPYPPGGTFGNGNHRADAPGDGVLCFARGTIIATEHGDVAVEDLEPGDLVITRGNGPQPLRWIGKTTRRAKGNLAPVRIKAGALGDNLPARDLLVSPAHRMLVSGWRAEVLFGEPEYLVPAKALVNDDTVTIARDLEEIEYFHIMFDDHEIVISEGAPSESFHPSQDAIGALDSDARAELLSLFPELEDVASGKRRAPARPTLSAAEARLLN